MDQYQILKQFTVPLRSPIIFKYNIWHLSEKLQRSNILNLSVPIQKSYPYLSYETVELQTCMRTREMKLLATAGAGAVTEATTPPPTVAKTTRERRFG